MVKALAAEFPNGYRKITVNNCITELHRITVKIQEYILQSKFIKIQYKIVYKFWLYCIITYILCQ